MGANCCCCCWRRKNIERGSDNYNKNKVPLVHIFSYKDLAHATSSFNNLNLIGEGPLGEVYKGQILNQTVAIKKLNIQAAEQQPEVDFLADMRALSVVNHRNLVKLVGYCCEGLNRLLVSEYVTNTSLYVHLHRNQKTTTPLGWSKRMKIALGSAKALNYLHQYCQPKIIHRDIKADNILLDDDFTPKVSDFALAKFFLGSESINHISYLMKGTPIYADPDKQAVSEKSDVYSFGVVLLELISGRKPLADRVSIIEWAKPLILQVLGNEINISRLIDPKLIAILSEEQMEQHRSEMEMMLFCAAASVYKPSEDRPSMSQIVQALEMEIPLNQIWDIDKDHFAFLQP